MLFVALQSKEDVKTAISHKWLFDVPKTSRFMNQYQLSVQLLRHGGIQKVQAFDQVSMGPDVADSDFERVHPNFVGTLARWMQVTLTINRPRLIKDESEIEANLTSKYCILAGSDSMDDNWNVKVLLDHYPGLRLYTIWNLTEGQKA